MATNALESDYLVIGAGAAGMAFTDSLVSESDAETIIVDRRHAPGGHWNEAYPFVRLHQPSSFYGVNSQPLGTDTIDRYGPNEGFYEQASAPEICAYYDRVMQRHLLPSGRVRYFPMCNYIGENRFLSSLTGEMYEVKVRKKLVDARYLETSVPCSTPPPFEVAPEARCVPVNELSRLSQPAGYVIIGAGKTAMDACIWLLQNDVAPNRITWIKPREPWLQNREYLQGGELIGSFFEGLARQMEAAAQASSVDDLFERLAESEQFLSVDERVKPTMYRGPTLSKRELGQLRQIENVVRLGKVRRIERDTIVLDQGEVATSPDFIHVHCATNGLNPAAEVPVFGEGRITLQSIRIGLIPFNAALIGYVEATRATDEEKNRLCPPIRQPNAPIDWVRGMMSAMNADYLWSKEPDIASWLGRSRLNNARGITEHMGDVMVQQARERFARNVRPALANMARICTERER